MRPDSLRHNPTKPDVSLMRFIKCASLCGSYAMNLLPLFWSLVFRFVIEKLIHCIIVLQPVSLAFFSCVLCCRSGALALQGIPMTP